MRADNRTDILAPDARFAGRTETPTVIEAGGMKRASLLITFTASLVLTAPASAAPYYSPGYKGTESFRNVTPAPLPPLLLGTGKYPNLLVDRAGTGHILFAQDGGTDAPDTLAFCNLQRGIKTCASAGLAPNPQAPDASQGGDFAGNFPGGNHDFDGPAPLVIGNQLFVVDRRFPDVFTTPSGATSQSNVFEWSSVDGGATITGPGQIGDNQMAGGAVAFGDPSAPSIGTISRTQTGGTSFQASGPGEYTTSKAQLGTGDQAYDGRLAVDESTPSSLPVAAFADLSGNVFVREWSGQGSPNDESTWTRSSFPGYSPQIIGGPAGVFVLYSDRSIGGKLSLRRIVNGQPGAGAVSLGKASSDVAVSEDLTGAIAFAYADHSGVWTRSSSNGVDFSPPQFTASIPKNGSIAHLVTAATSDGGGFVSFVRNPSGAEGVGQVIVSAFGDQRATGQPGLGPLPGGGIGSAAGDQMATSTCQTAKFGVVEARITAGCYGHDPNNPNLDVTLGELDLNGLRIIPDPGARIGIDPKAHTIDTTGKVRVVLTAGGLDITLWHEALHVQVPNDGPGDTLVDLKDFAGQIAPAVQGFPIDGDIDIKLANGGVEIPISLKLPKYLGGVSGSATLHATTSGGLELSSLVFTIGDANLGALELKDVVVSYTMQGNVWKGEGKVWVPAGGDAFRAAVKVEFDDGEFKSGTLDVGLPYPGIPLDESDPPPQLYLSHLGLGLGLNPLTITGTAGLGAIPLAPPGEGSEHAYVSNLDGQLDVAFGTPVTFTVRATAFLFGVQFADGVFIYKIPNQASLTGTLDYTLGIFELKGNLSAIFDPPHNQFGGQISSEIIVHTGFPGVDDVSIPGLTFAVNKVGIALFIPLTEAIKIPVPPFLVAGTVSYRWGSGDLSIDPYQNTTGPFKEGIPPAASDGARARAAGAMSFTVPANAPTANLIVHGSGGSPQVALIGPGGQPVPLDNQVGAGEHAAASAEPSANVTHVGILHPRPGRWTVVEAGGSQIPIIGVQYSIGETPPKVSATVTGTGFNRTVRYRATIPANVVVTLAESTGRFLHVIGQVQGRSGTIRFRPAFGPSGRRELIAQIANNGVAVHNQTLGSFSVPRLQPRRAAGLRVLAGRRTFSYSFSPPSNAAHTLIRIVATDGRHLQRVVSPGTRSGSVPVIGFRDGLTVTVIGLAADGSPGPAISAAARRRA
jgi:hypothetical protein